MSKEYDLIVIGAGPAGMMAAITASGNGSRVALVEKNPQIGRKLLSTGNGRCNLTNKRMSTRNFHGAPAEFVQKVLDQFDQNAVIDLFQDLGLILKEEDNGRIFPRTNQAASVIEVMKRKLIRNGVDVLTGLSIQEMKGAPCWNVFIQNGQVLTSDRLLIATGGRAAHQLGSTGDGLGWASKMGHSITPTYAALVPLESLETWPAGIQGLKLEVGIRSIVDGRVLCESYGDVHFANYGISGPAAMAQAGHIAPFLKSTHIDVQIDLFPEISTGELKSFLMHIFAADEKRTLREALIGILPGNLIPVVAGMIETDENEIVSNIPEAYRQNLLTILKNVPLTIIKLRPYKEAQVTSGGIDASEIDPSAMRSKIVENLYFGGEIVDVDGDSGGYNLQWAWSSGYVAGLMH